MPSYTTADIRNVLVAGHGASGKTALIDALLFASKTVTRHGNTADGSSFSDFEKEEKEHKHSIYSCLLHADHDGKRINLIDTPGSPDLMGGALACLPAVETVAVVINAPNGIEVVTRRIMEAAKDRNLCRAIIVNKIDMPEVDLEGLVSQIQETFGHECLPINLPSNGGKAVVECLLNRDGTSDISSVADAHTAILDQIVEIDEGLMEKYLGGEEPN
ncbi:MAG TPA: GTP-binding protein, partial [Tepidisphaeraceae bacterium]|nr:GTP-binding protein [Tepidisphaeraceae bacterium]